MKPKFRITHPNPAVMQAVNDRLITMQVNDSVEDKSDAVWLTLDGRDAIRSLPRPGDNIDVQFGYEHEKLSEKKRYLVSEASFSGPPDTVDIRAHAADFTLGSTHKARKSRGWENTTIGAIIASVAAEQGLTAVVAPELAEVVIARRDQVEESDIGFCYRLADDYDAHVCVKGNAIYFVESVTGLARFNPRLQVVTVGRDDLIDWRFDFIENGRFTGIKAKWHDFAGGVTASELFGDDRSIYTIRRTFATADEALRAAKAEYARRVRRRASGQLEIIGNHKVFAGGTIDLQINRPPLDDKWYVQSVQHTLSDEGFVSVVDVGNSKPR